MWADFTVHPSIRNIHEVYSHNDQGGENGASHRHSLLVRKVSNILILSTRKFTYLLTYLFHKAWQGHVWSVKGYSRNRRHAKYEYQSSFRSKLFYHPHTRTHARAHTYTADHIRPLRRSVTTHRVENSQYIGWQRRNIFIILSMPAVFPPWCGQALRNVCHCDNTFLVR